MQLSHTRYNIQKSKKIVISSNPLVPEVSNTTTYCNCKARWNLDMRTKDSIMFRLSRCLWCVVLTEIPLHLSRLEISLTSFLCIAPALSSPIIHTNYDFAKRQGTTKNCHSFASNVDIYVVITATPTSTQVRQFKSVPLCLYIMYVCHFLMREVKLLSY